MIARLFPLALVTAACQSTPTTKTEPAPEPATTTTFQTTATARLEVKDAGPGESAIGVARAADASAKR